MRAKISDDVKRLKTGVPSIDHLLNGGLEKGIITTVFGPAASGKSNISLISMINAPDKVVLVDSENSLSVERLKQITPNVKEFLDKTMVFKPTTLKEQGKVLDTLKQIIGDNISLLVIDSISMLYRLEMATNDVKGSNSEFSKQLATLMDIAQSRKIPILLISQVYADFKEKEKINIVGGDLIKYSSKCLVELETHGDKRLAILRKHRSIADNTAVWFKIKNKGLEMVQDDLPEEYDEPQS